MKCFAFSKILLSCFWFLFHLVFSYFLYILAKFNTFTRSWKPMLKFNTFSILSISRGNPAYYCVRRLDWKMTLDRWLRCCLHPFLILLPFPWICIIANLMIITPSWTLNNVVVEIGSQVVQCLLWHGDLPHITLHS